MQARFCRLKVFHSTFVIPQCSFMDGVVGRYYAEVAQSFGIDTPPAFLRTVRAVEDVMLKSFAATTKKG